MFITLPTKALHLLGSFIYEILHLVWDKDYIRILQRYTLKSLRTETLVREIYTYL